MYRTTIGHALRRQARAIVVIAVLCGIVVGVGLWGLAGARRTASTYERYLADAGSSDLSVNVNSADRPLTLDEVVGIVEAAGRLDGVERSATYVGMESMALEADVERPVTPMEVVGSLDGRFLEQDRVAVTEGRLPAADRVDEVLITERGARARGLAVGDRTRVGAVDIRDLEAFTGEGELPIAGIFEVEIVGFGVFPDDVVDDEYDRIDRLLLTPAATERWLDVAGSYVWHGMRLDEGAAVDGILAEYRELAGEGAFVNTLVTADQAADVQRAIGPLVVALAVFGAAALLAALAVGAISVSRLTRGRPELAVLRAIGLRPRQLVIVGAAPAAATGLLTAAVGVAVAVVLSPLAPVGAVRAVEPARGVDLDAAVLLPGFAIAVLALVVAAVATARGIVRPREAGAARDRLPWAARVGARLPPTTSLGIQRGVGSSQVTGAPTRSTLVGSAIALVAVAAAVTFGASLTELSDRPDRYGWAADLALTAGSGYDTIDLDEAGRLADGDERVEALTVAGYTDVELDGRFVPAMAAAAVRGEPLISVLEGRFPNGPGEVALGGRTARDLDVDRGAELDGLDQRLEVVGIVAFPAIGPVTSAHPAMGEGALFPLEVLGEGGAQPSIAFIDLADGVDPGAAAEDLTEIFTRSTDGGFMEPFTLLRPAELDGAEDANGTVRAIAGVVGVAALAGSATVVTASVRARRRELAILRALGCTAADLRRSVRWQAASLAVVALVMGIPLGVAGGRVLWQTFADTLGVDPAPTVPLALLGAAALVVLLLTVATALPAARQASRMSVAPALRPE